MSTAANVPAKYDTDNVRYIGISMDEVCKLAITCAWLARWAHQAPTAVAEALGGEGALVSLVSDLEDHADHLLRLVPSVSPTPAPTPVPLMAGEALGLAEVLASLATEGWPEDPRYAEALRADCAAWAERLLSVPGARP